MSALACRKKIIDDYFFVLARNGEEICCLNATLLALGEDDSGEDWSRQKDEVKTQIKNLWVGRAEIDQQAGESLREYLETVTPGGF